MKTMQPRNLSRHESGAAILVVMTFLALITALLLCNTSLLDGLKRELRLVEQKQQKKFSQPQGVPGTPQATPNR